MRLSFKKIVSNNLLVKIVSFVFGYCLWTLISNAHLHTLDVEVPLCFFNQPAILVLQAPETVQLQLCGKRNSLRSINTKTLALHVDASQLHVGENPIVLESESLFLPKTIKLVHYTPANLVVQAQEMTQNS